MARVKYSTTIRNNMVDYFSSFLDGGGGPAVLKLYSGPELATAEEAISSQTLIASLELSANSFEAAINGSASQNPVNPDTNIAGGVVVQGVMERIDGFPALWVDVGVPGSGAAIEISGNNDSSGDVVVSQGGVIRITSLSITFPAEHTW